MSAPVLITRTLNKSILKRTANCQIAENDEMKDAEMTKFIDTRRRSNSGVFPELRRETF